MFEIRVYCEDKKLTELLWALDGKIVGQPQLLPVRDAKPSRDKTKVVGKGPINKEVLYALIKSKGAGKKITSKEMSATLVANGSGGHTVGGYVDLFLKNRVLKRTSKGEYVITNIFPDYLVDPAIIRSRMKENVHG